MKPAMYILAVEEQGRKVIPGAPIVYIPLPCGWELKKGTYIHEYSAANIPSGINVDRL